MNQRWFKFAIAGAAVVAVILVGAQLFSVNRADSGTAPDAHDDYFKGLPMAGTTIGRADAAVLVEEYMDFQCPACQTASEQIVKPLIQKYVADGSVRFAYRFFPFMGPESVAAAQAAYCAATEGAFWPYQQVLFAQRGTGNRGTYSVENLVRYATEIGLDEETFRACLTSEDAQVYAQGSYQRGVQLGIPGTPTFFVNGRRVEVNSYAAIEQAIEAALRQSGR